MFGDISISISYFKASAKVWTYTEKSLSELRTLFGEHHVATSTPPNATPKDFELAVNEWTFTFMPCLPEALALSFFAMREKELRSMREIRKLHAELERRFEDIIWTRHDRGRWVEDDTTRYWNCNPCRSRIVHLALLSEKELAGYDTFSAEERDIYWSITPLCFEEREFSRPRIAQAWPA